MAPTNPKRVADWLEAQAARTEPGERIGSIVSISAALGGVSAGAVKAGVDEACVRGVPIERRRGPQGGYYMAAVAERRWIKVVIDDIDPDAYADLAHAIWTAAALIGSEKVSLESDGKSPPKYLNDRWKDLGRNAPWS